MSPQQEARIAEALRHVAMGFAVFSVWSTDDAGVCRCGKPHTGDEHSIGKHPIPRDGFKAASRDPKVVTTMLSAGSEPNYGIVWPEGEDVVFEWDVDGAEWKAKIEALKATYGPLPKTKTTRSPSGGLHVFYRWPAGVPVPDGNTLHGFVVRWPWKGYVVGPGSRINGTMYADVGSPEIATLPMSWAVTETVPARPALITVSGDIPGYELPVSVSTGKRHDEITRFVASRWNRGISKAEIEASIGVLTALFEEPASPEKVQRDIDEAWDTAARKWKTPGSPVGGTVEGVSVEDDQTTTAGGRMVVEVGLLDPNTPVAPLAMHSDAKTTSVQLGMLLHHFEPRTDAGEEGLLVTALVYLGALMGHSPSCFYGSREQHTNFMALLVGESGASRKGTTVDLVRGALAQCTDGVRGLKQSANSGEGLIALAAKADGAPILIEEEEFDRFMTAKGRDGSTLSSILRQAFDDVPLSSSTAAKTVRADVHHIALLGNVTRSDIEAKMESVDLKNGFANRIAWTGVFPKTGHKVTVHDNALDTTTRDSIRDAIRFTQSLTKPLIGGTTHQIDGPARDLLAAAAERYNAGVGLAPFLSRRLDTIAARIALIYACLDHDRVISVTHVEAALAVTDYAWHSARWVFPETTGDQDADLVLRHLRVAGFLSTRELEALVGKRPRDKQRVADLLGLMGYARIAERPRSDGKPGRPARGLEVIP